MDSTRFRDRWVPALLGLLLLAGAGRAESPVGKSPLSAMTSAPIATNTAPAT